MHGTYAKFLPAAWRSLLAQTHQDWRWLVQADGIAADVLGPLIECGADRDPRVAFAINGTREGPAITRNVALGRATAPLIQNLDADDELEPTALEAMVAALHAHPTAGFAVGPARDLLDSGDLVEFPLPFAAGLIARGALVDAWITEPERYCLPVHPAGVMWRRELLIAAGGWTAMHNMEDTGLLMAASALSPGVVIDTVTLRYRRHLAQRSTKTTNFEGGGSRLRSFAVGPPCCVTGRRGAPETADRNSCAR